MRDQHQADVAATEGYSPTVVERLRALAARLNDIADHRETGSDEVFAAFFGTENLPAKDSDQMRDTNAIKAANEAIQTMRPRPELLDGSCADGRDLLLADGTRIEGLFAE